MKNGSKRKASLGKRIVAEESAVEASCGNVYADLEIPEPDEALAKAEVVRRICDIIRQKRLTQRRAAGILAIGQPQVSALMRGKLDDFSTERLFRFLNALGNDVDIVIRPRRERQEPASTRVTLSSSPRRE